MARAVGSRARARAPQTAVGGPGRARAVWPSPEQRSGCATAAHTERRATGADPGFVSSDIVYRAAPYGGACLGCPSGCMRIRRPRLLHVECMPFTPAPLPERRRLSGLHATAARAPPSPSPLEPPAAGDEAADSPPRLPDASSSILACPRTEENSGSRKEANLPRNGPCTHGPGDIPAA